MMEKRGKQAAGDKQGRKPWTLKEFGGKPVWEWMQLLIVPLALAVIGLLFEMQQADRQRATEKQQQVLENQRAEAERELAEQRAQDEALQTYLDQMGDLLLAKDGLRESEEGSEVRTLARARTITVLGSLDPSGGSLNPSRKTALMQFLVEAHLVQGVEERDPIINLRGADLRKAYLYDAVDNLSGANLRNADLTEANLSGADLIDADLHRATLIDADLTDADLTDAHLADADLTDASGITNEELDQQAETLEGATMPNGQKYEDWVKDKGG